MSQQAKPDDTDSPVEGNDPDEATNVNDMKGYSGQAYHIDEESAEGRKHPSGEVNSVPPSASENSPDLDIPPENGRRASFDPQTGEVHGAGSGAGGGNPGEDYDSDPMAGSGYPRTGHGDEGPVIDAASE